jgi:uncharacterized protein (DUF2147 family)
LRSVVAFLFFLAISTAHAQSTPVGLWKTVDDKTGQEKSLVRITEANGLFTGRIEKLLHPSQPNPLCGKCRDDRHDQPMLGLTVIEGIRHRGDVWEDGSILDPDNGRIYTLRLKILDGGKALEVRGYIGPFFRTQNWSRVD